MIQKWQNSNGGNDFLSCRPCLFYWCFLLSFFHDIVWWTLMTDWQSHDISIFQAHKGNFRKRATLQNAHFYFSEYSHLGSSSTQRSEKYTKGQISGQSIKYLAFVIAIFVKIHSAKKYFFRYMKIARSSKYERVG